MLTLHHMSRGFKRRELFAGAIWAALATAIGPAPVKREPRLWKKAEYHCVRPYNSDISICFYVGTRSDGVSFMVQQALSLLDACAITRRQNYIDTCIANARLELDSFLDSGCDCRIGYHCDLHSRFREPVDVEFEEVA